jgi:hypothetical protein
MVLPLRQFIGLLTVFLDVLSGSSSGLEQAFIDHDAKFLSADIAMARCSN